MIKNESIINNNNNNNVNCKVQNEKLHITFYVSVNSRQ